MFCFNNSLALVSFTRVCSLSLSVCVWTCVWKNNLKWLCVCVVLCQVFAQHFSVLFQANGRLDAVPSATIKIFYFKKESIVFIAQFLVCKNSNGCPNERRAKSHLERNIVWACHALFFFPFFLSADINSCATVGIRQVFFFVLFNIFFQPVPFGSWVWKHFEKRVR